MRSARQISWVPIVALACLFPALADAADFRVFVSCDGVDIRLDASEDARTMLVAETESYLKRELRSIGDVSVVPSFTDADFAISVDVFRTPSGHCLSATFFRVTHTLGVQRWWDHGRIPDGCAEAVDEALAWFDGVLTYAGGMYSTRPHDELKMGCETIDTTILEPYRSAAKQ